MIIRTEKQKDPFARVSKKALADARLSWKAKGILAYLMGQPHDWRVQVSDLINRSQEGEYAVYSALKELRLHGYASLQTVRNTEGRIQSKEWVVRDYSEEAPNKLDPGFHDQGNHDQGNQDITNKDMTKHKYAAAARDARIRSRGDGFGLAKESIPSQLVQDFAQFTIDRHLHVGKLGSTAQGWSKTTLKQWEKSLQTLKLQLNGESHQIEEVMRWYFDHRDDAYTPQANTLPAFCRKFSELREALRRHQGSSSNGEEAYRPRITVEYDHDED